MTNSPVGKNKEYKTATELDRLYDEHGFEAILACCQKRIIVDSAYRPGKYTHSNTTHERGEVFKDDSGLRAVIFHYTQSNGETLRSIKRLITDTTDFRIFPSPSFSGK